MIHLKRWMGAGLLFVFTLVFWTGDVRAQSNILGLVTVDEYGNGNYFGPPVANFIVVHPLTNFPLASILAPDPTGGVLGWNVLTYRLPFLGVAGDVLIHEPGNTNQISDIIRFDGNGHLIFYSDSLDGFGEPADVPDFPDPLLANRININETGPEGSNFADYTPKPGEPGYAAWNGGLMSSSYHFISDSVPEPGCATLLLAGVGLGLLKQRRRDGAS